MLEEEIVHYQRNYEVWKTQYPGKFVLIKGSELIGAYDTMEEALDRARGNMGWLLS